MSALACFRSPATQHLLSLLIDPELINCLTDALFRCKTRPVYVLLSTVLRMLLWPKYLCGKISQSLEIDYSDSPDVRQFYAIELITLAKRVPYRIIADANMIFGNVDELTKTRMQNSIPGIQSNTLIEDEMETDADEHLDYIQLLKINRKFGCSTFESCLNPNAVLKRIFEQIVLEANKLNQICENNPRIDLARFSSEIFHISDMFIRLQNEIQ